MPSPISHTLIIRIIFSVLLIIAAFHSARAVSEDEIISSRSLFEKTEKIDGKNLTYPYPLKYWPIIPNTEKVWVNNEPKVRGLDYTIDYRTGQILIETPVPEKSKVRINYQIIPISIRRLYQNRIFQSPKTEDITEPEKESEISPKTPDQELPPTLNFSGTKTLSLSMESARGLTINQPTRLNVSGNVSETVSVNAMLSDQDLPLQPEGTTEELEELDRILIEVKGKNLSATLGDYEASFDDTEFVLLPKMLEGAQAQGKFDVGSFSVLGAVSRGKSSSITLQGIEGQNEYRVDVDSRFIIMIAGSETVWLNGEKMRRGDDNDYIIRDYGDPIVEFTNKHLITANDVIIVDFEYLEEDNSYRQELYGTRGKINIFSQNGYEDGIKNYLSNTYIGVSYAIESDDKDNPLVLLTPEEITYLEENELDPDDDGILLPAPTSRSVIGFDSAMKIADTVNLSGEIAIGKFDTNTFSRLDKQIDSKAWRLRGNSDQDEKAGFSFDIRNLDPDFIPIGATTASRARGGFQEEFNDIGFGGITTGSINIPQAESAYDLDLWLILTEYVRISGDMGKTWSEYKPENSLNDLERVKNETSHWSRSLELSLPGIPDVRNRYQEALTRKNNRDSQKRTREIWQLDHKIWEKINIGAQREETKAQFVNQLEPLYDNQQDSRQQKQRFTFRIPSFKEISLSGEYSHEVEYVDYGTDDINWLKLSSAQTASANITARPKTWLDFSGYFARRKFKRLREMQGTYSLPSDTTTNLADMKLNINPLRVSYQVDKKLSTQQEEVYINYIINLVDGVEEKRFLKPGEGSYVKIDEYTYREDTENGEYIRLIRSVGDKPVTSVTMQSVLSLRPRSFIQSRDKDNGQNILKKYIVDALSILELGVRLVEEQEEASTNLYLLRNLQNQNTIYGLRRYWSRFHASPIKQLSIKADWESSKNINKRISERAREYTSQRWRITTEVPLNINFSLGGEWERDNSSEDVSSLDDSRIDEDIYNLVSNISEQKQVRSVFLKYSSVGQLSRFKTAGIYEKERDQDSSSDEPSVFTRTISLDNEAVWRFRSKGSITTRYEIARGTSSGTLPFARYDFHEGISHKIRLEISYRLKWFTDIIARLIYRGEIAQDDKPDHRIEAEMTANF
ncbi:hypothetical protein GF312_17865 [Candidatus Poribacteria bacterium]|nr:hypothetical protein [Candidatus Poribacteria bacterium]